MDMNGTVTSMSFSQVLSAAKSHDYSQFIEGRKECHFGRYSVNVVDETADKITIKVDDENRSNSRGVRLLKAIGDFFVRLVSPQCHFWQTREKQLESVIQVKIDNQLDMKKCEELVRLEEKERKENCRKD